MKKLRNAIIIFFSIGLFLVLVGGISWRYYLRPVNKKSDLVSTIIIDKGASSVQIAEQLEENKLIKSDKFFKLYLKIFEINNLKAGTYELKQSMSMTEIVEILKEGNNYNSEEIKLTFKEGLNVVQMANLIEKNTVHQKEDFYLKLKDDKYLDSLIKKYWFLTDEIKNSLIYHSLEGYLFPDTYFFKNKEVSLETIIEKMLDNFSIKFSSEEKTLKESNYSIHQLLTLASIIELEGVSLEDRKLISGVFYNRLEAKMSLGSDVTSYYGKGIDMKDRDLTKAEFEDLNPYNTRSASMAGKLPVGPVSNPSKDAILASLYPSKSDYFYFVADKYRKVFFTKTFAEHEAKIKEIKDKGDWYTW